jgi:riboflavin synthase
VQIVCSPITPIKKKIEANMFTGIVETAGKVAEIQDKGDAIRYRIEAKEFFRSCKEGDSVANNGVCLTVEESDENAAWFTMVRQTLKVSAFSEIKEGDLVNLEHPCSMNSLLGGHYVMGHVDGVATVSKITPLVSGQEVDLDLPEETLKYVIAKGSITLHGISLTIAEKLEKGIRVAIIPETLRITNMSEWKVGTLVNFEVDVLGKYVENLVAASVKEHIAALQK